MLRATDTGCGLKAMRREAFLRLPYFDHVHRYLPALMIREGYDVAFEPVGHRQRQTGRSKYTNFGRLWVSFSDLSGVMWLNARARHPGDSAVAGGWAERAGGDGADRIQVRTIVSHDNSYCAATARCCATDSLFRIRRPERLSSTS